MGFPRLISKELTSLKVKSTRLFWFSKSQKRSYSLRLFKISPESFIDSNKKGLLSKVDLPIAIQNLNPGELTAFTCGPHHYSAVVNQLLYTWGSNGFGQLGPVNTSFELMESNDEDEVMGNPFLVPGAFNRPTSECQPSTNVSLAAGHFSTMALDYNNNRAWTWGAGILGRGSEVYDPLPAPIGFFAEANIKVKNIYSSGDYSIAIGTQSHLQFEDGAGRRLVYIWGYLPDGNDQSTVKANFPIVVKDLAGDQVQQLAVTPTGFSALVRETTSPGTQSGANWGLKWFGSTVLKENPVPYYPYFLEDAEQLHSYHFLPAVHIRLPFRSLDGAEGFQLTAGAGIVGILKSNRLLLLSLFDSKNHPETLISTFSNVQQATLTEEGLSFVTSSKTESRIHYLPKSRIPFSIMSNNDSTLPTFEQLVDTMATKTSHLLENPDTQSLEIDDKTSFKTMKHEYGKIWVL